MCSNLNITTSASFVSLGISEIARVLFHIEGAIFNKNHLNRRSPIEAKKEGMVVELEKEFSKSKSMELPRRIVVGHNAIEDVGKKVAGDKVKEVLEGEGITSEFFMISDATKEVVDELAGIIKGDKIDFILGVGGGRPIDVAKCSSYESKIPFISCPTAASHDGLVSAQASIIGDDGKASVRAHPPLGVIMDTNIISHAPYRLLAAGCGDIISNATAVKDWTLARNLRGDEYSNYAASLSEMTAYMLIENADLIKPGLEESSWYVSKALVSSGVAMSIAGSSRPASGSEHLFSHALDRIVEKPALHGEQCGVGTIMMMYLHGGDWQKIKDCLLAIGAPTTARALDVKDEEVIEALVHAHEVKKDRYTILGDNGLTYEAAERLARITKVV
jgi:glycerol-1-phosphate dehydrogenase [NAD(P)+]